MAFSLGALESKITAGFHSAHCIDDSRSDIKTSLTALRETFFTLGGSFQIKSNHMNFNGGFWREGKSGIPSKKTFRSIVQKQQNGMIWVT